MFELIFGLGIFIASIFILSMLAQVAWSYITTGHGPVHVADAEISQVTEFLADIFFPWARPFDALFYGKINHDLYNFLGCLALMIWFFVLAAIIVYAGKFIKRIRST